MFNHYDRVEMRERFYDEGYEAPPGCPWPDCDGGVVGKVEKNYGADRDGNRGIDIHYSECNVCERDPSDFDEDEWMREKTFEYLRMFVDYIKKPEGFKEKDIDVLADELEEFVEQYE